MAQKPKINPTEIRARAHTIRIKLESAHKDILDLYSTLKDFEDRRLSDAYRAASGVTEALTWIKRELAVGADPDPLGQFDPE